MMHQSWFDEAEYILNLHESKQKEFGVARAGRPDTLTGHNGWGVRDTCKLTNFSIRRVIEDLRIGRALRLNSSLKNGSRQEALGKIPKDKQIEKLMAVLRTCIVKLKTKNHPVAKELEAAINDFEKGLNEFRHPRESQKVSPGPSKLSQRARTVSKV